MLRDGTATRSATTARATDATGTLPPTITPTCRAPKPNKLPDIDTLDLTTVADYARHDAASGDTVEQSPRGESNTSTGETHTPRATLALSLPASALPLKSAAGSYGDVSCEHRAVQPRQATPPAHATIQGTTRKPATKGYVRSRSRIRNGTARLPGARTVTAGDGNTRPRNCNYLLRCNIMLHHRRVWLRNHQTNARTILPPGRIASLPAWSLQSRTIRQPLLPY